MSDQVNIQITGYGEEVNLHTRWDGSKALGIVRSAMIRGGEYWNNGPYLARIIFSEMIQDDVLGIRGFGIWGTEMDGGLISVDVESYIVTHGDTQWTFGEFTNILESNDDFSHVGV